MEPRTAAKRFNRETGKPALAEARPPTATPETELEPAELLTRLERQAEESGRLEGRVQILEAALKSEREARRRLGESVQRERSAARAVHERAEAERAEVEIARAELQTAREELAGLREAHDDSERQVQMAWARLVQVEQQLAWRERSLWRKLFRRPPAA